ncbi:hypothetical protein PTKIN_Ptkin02bG0119400 [Pterospermum kingtungense]
MKFNVDGSAKGCPGDVGIGRVLRDYDAIIKIVLLEYVGIVDLNLEELLAVRKAFILFLFSMVSFS